MAEATLVFDKGSYLPTDTITFTVQVDVPMTESVVVQGHVELPDGSDLPATSTTTVSGTYGPFTATGYVVEQDPTSPSVFHATPSAS